jgi:hypothetical protein
MPLGLEARTAMRPNRSAMARKRYLARAKDKGWKRAFEDPIQLSKGRQLITIEDAGNYITKLPKAEHSAPEWQTAIEMLITAAETGGGWLMFARMAVMKALNRHVERVFTSRKNEHWGKRKLKRDKG